MHDDDSDCNTPDDAEELSLVDARRSSIRRAPLECGKLLTSMTGIFLLRPARLDELWNCMCSAALHAVVNEYTRVCLGTPAVLRQWSLWRYDAVGRRVPSGEVAVVEGKGVTLRLAGLW